MRKVKREDYYELAVFLMDFHSGQTSRGYRLLSKLSPKNFSSTMMEACRETEIYQYLVATYSRGV